MKRLLWFVLFFNMLFANAISQNADSLNVTNTSDKGQFFVEINSNAFFDNIEFFNNIQRGYTLTGFNFEPRLAYEIKSKAKISGGVHLLYFSGERELTRVAPVLTFSTKLAKGLTLNLGTINGKGRHGLPEQLFKAEREFTHQPENGVQFLFNSKFFNGETWVNWEKSLYRKDTIQEEFTAGISAQILAIENDNFNLTFPLYALAVHRGGQINVSSEPVSTLANFAGGVNISNHFNGFGTVGFETLLVFGRDISPNPHHPFQKGWAVFPRSYYKSKNWFADIGYWNAKDLILPRGEEIFGSLSTVSPDFNESKRELITANILYSKEVAQGFSLAIGGQVYYDIKNTLMDYSFFFVASFSDTFKIKR
jgi:hypothetical protein